MFNKRIFRQRSEKPHWKSLAITRDSVEWSKFPFQSLNFRLAGRPLATKICNPWNYHDAEFDRLRILRARMKNAKLLWVRKYLETRNFKFQVETLRPVINARTQCASPEQLILFSDPDFSKFKNLSIRIGTFLDQKCSRRIKLFCLNNLETAQSFVGNGSQPLRPLAVNSELFDPPDSSESNLAHTSSSKWFWISMQETVSHIHCLKICSTNFVV